MGRRLVTRSELRKEAYKYILLVLNGLPIKSTSQNWIQLIPLEELRLVKEGIADPSPTLVTLLKELLVGVISEDAINSHLVVPFENYKIE